MRRAIRQMIRGCGELPYVGEHPGTEVLFIFLLMGALAGAKGGWFGVLGGFLIMALFMVPMYLWGAYDRAQMSDGLMKVDEET